MRNSGLLVIAIVLAALFILNNCSENPYFIGNNVLEPKTRLVMDTIYAVQDTFYLTTPEANTIVATNIFLGAWNGVELRPVYRFTELPVNAKFQSIKMMLIGKAAIGEPSQPFTATAYPILNSWTSNTDSVWKAPDQNYDATLPLGTVVINPVETDTFFLEFNEQGLAQFNQWSDTATTVADNYGIILVPENPTFVKQLKSILYDQTDERNIFYTYKLLDDTTLYSDSTASTVDAYIIRGTFNTVSNRDIVSTMSIYSTLLRFDLEPIIEKYGTNIIINSANLQLGIDRENSLIRPGQAANLTGHSLLSDLDTPDIVLDSVQARYFNIVSWSSDTTFAEIGPGVDRQVLAQNFIQTNLREKKYGLNLLIRFSTTSDNLMYYALYKVNEPSRRPRIILTISEVPEPRF